MVGLGTIFIAIMAVSAFLLWRGKFFEAHWMLWILVSLPFPYIANTAGWMTAEIGRQLWLVYGLMRTADGYSKMVSAGNGLFTLLGFMGMYMVRHCCCHDRCLCGAGRVRPGRRDHLPRGRKDGR
jgi:cytochrome d ubiquinol oxidase subunit I